jgi:glycine/D-amino acid oxidase-like deaminating enzyme
MLTQKRRLRSGETFWESTRPARSNFSEAPAKRFYDVIIVGCGISGALVAHQLSNLHLDVLVLDRRLPGAGSTSASTALIQWEIDVPLTRLSAKVGHKKAQDCYKASYRAVQALRRKISASGLQCDMRPRKTLLIAGTDMDAKALLKETKARRAIRLPSMFLDATELKKKYGFDRKAAIESLASLEIDPLKLTLACLAQAQARNVEVVSPALVTALDVTSAGAFVTLSSGVSIACRKVIVTTGYEVLPQVSRQKYNLISTWALATVPQPAHALWRKEALVWEASDPYLYFRTTKDRRIIVGGEDADFKDPARRDKLIQKKSADILRKLAKLLPHATLTADFQWAGTFAESPTGLPVIGPVDPHNTVFAVLGAGGNGITFSEIASSLAKAWVQGKSHTLAALFAPDIKARHAWS